MNKVTCFYKDNDNRRTVINLVGGSELPVKEEPSEIIHIINCIFQDGVVGY